MVDNTSQNDAELNWSCGVINNAEVCWLHELSCLNNYTIAKLI